MGEIGITSKLTASPRKLKLNSEFCLVRQGEEPVQFENIDSKKLQDIIDSLREHEKYQSSKHEHYNSLTESIGSLTGSPTKGEWISVPY